MWQLFCSHIIISYADSHCIAVLKMQIQQKLHSASSPYMHVCALKFMCNKFVYIEKLISMQQFL